MKRDWRIIRDILLTVEQHCDAKKCETTGTPLGKYQVYLLRNGGYLSTNHDDWPWDRLSWKGFELADSLRDAAAFDRAMVRLAKVGGSAPTDILVALVEQEKAIGPRAGAAS